jgi:hypothetical protein
MAAHAAAIYDRLVSLGARYLQFQPLMSEGASRYAPPPAG